MKKTGIKYTAAFVAMALLAGGCGNENTEGVTQAEETVSATDETQMTEEEPAADGEPADIEMKESLSDTGSKREADSSETSELKNMFGENCIEEQTFEVELNGETVYFVSYAQSEDHPDIYMQLIRDGKILAQFTPSVHGKSFTSLEAVSFWDVNFDGLTDIILTVAFREEPFAIVYYCDTPLDEERWYFYIADELSESISEQVEPLTIAGIRNLLTGGKRNGEFDSYAEAYEAVITLTELEQQEESTEEFSYSLIYVDEDEIPELVTGKNGYYVNLYTYQDGTLYTLMNHWGYGAMGNAGYEYSPGKNSLRNYNADQAGAIMNTYYMSISEQNEIETPMWIESFNFIDHNGNGSLDEDETFGPGPSYINGEEVSDEELEAVYAAYDKGDYRYIKCDMTVEAVRDALR